MNLADIDTYEMEDAFYQMLEVHERCYQYAEGLSEFAEYDSTGREIFLKATGWNEIGEDEQFMFREWFCFDFVPSFSNHTVAQQFLWQGMGLSSPEHRMLRALIDSYIGIYQVQRGEEILCLLPRCLHPPVLPRLPGTNGGWQ